MTVAEELNYCYNGKGKGTALGRVKGETPEAKELYHVKQKTFFQKKNLKINICINMNIFKH